MRRSRHVWVYLLFFCQPVLAYGQQSIACNAVSAPMIFTGVQQSSWFGARAHEIGDVDRDGVSDLLITARFEDGAGGVDSGRVRIFSGRTGALLQTIEGEGAGDEIGHRTGIIGDIDGDGSADILTSSYVNDAAGTDAGRAYVFSGATGLPIHTWSGEHAGDYFGWSVVSAGDINDDGVNDVLVAAPNCNGAQPQSGKVYLFDGRDGTLIRTWDGQGSNDHFGYRIPNVGDVDGDGYDDVLISAPGNNVGGAESGKVYLYSVRTGELIHSWEGEDADEHLGNRTEPAGDVDHDGHPDILIASDVASGVAGAQCGACYLFSGSTGLLLWHQEGQNAGDAFGYRVQGNCDLDGDGTPDFVVSAVYNDGAGPDSGRVYAYSGADYHLMYVWTGECAGDLFGRVVQCPGDVNGDGGQDLVIGALHSDANRNDSGRAYLISGKTGRKLLVINGEAAGDELGYSANNAGDVNQDGYSDFTLTAILNNAGAHDAGRTYVFLGAPLFIATTPLSRGHDASIMVTGARKNEVVQIFGNTAGLGEGPTVPFCGGLRLDIVEPVAKIGQVRADEHGEALLNGTVSNSVRSDSVFLQAVVSRGFFGQNSVKSQPVVVHVKQR